MVMKDSLRAGPQREILSAYEVLGEARQQFEEAWHEVHHAEKKELLLGLERVLGQTFDVWESDQPMRAKEHIEIAEVSLVYTSLVSSGKELDGSSSAGVLVKVSSPVERHVLLSTDLERGVAKVQLTTVDTSAKSFTVPLVNTQGEVHDNQPVKLFKDKRSQSDVVEKIAYSGREDVSGMEGISGAVELTVMAYSVLPVTFTKQVRDALQDRPYTTPDSIQESIRVLSDAKAVAELKAGDSEYLLGLIRAARAIVSGVIRASAAE
jgi:hypothetical protein